MQFSQFTKELFTENIRKKFIIVIQCDFKGSQNRGFGIDLGLKETMVQMAKANGVRWFWHVWRRDDEHVLRKMLEFEGKGKRKRGQPKKTWKMQVEKESKSVGLEKEDAMNRARRRVGVGKIAVRMG